METSKNKLLISLLLGGGVVLYLFSRSKKSIIYNNGFTPFTYPRKASLDKLDKLLLDRLDASEAQLATRLWEKAQPYTSLIQKYASQSGVPTMLVYSVIYRESVFVPTAIRWEANVKQKAFGLMQILPTTAKDMGFAGDEFQLIRPDINLKYGIKYLGYQMQRYKGDLTKVAAAYNAGSALYTTSGRFINQDYVNNVMRIYNLLDSVIVKG